MNDEERIIGVRAVARSATTTTACSRRVVVQGPTVRFGEPAGDPPFGSLLVGADGGVLAEDRNTVVTDVDITAHPEQKLARWAARELDPTTAAATTMYMSCQPCAMCTGAIEVRPRPRRVRALHRTARKPQTACGPATRATKARHCSTKRASQSMAISTDPPQRSRSRCRRG
jgi:tRNA(Arg) A34 adenosine deaminase TadA